MGDFLAALNGSAPSQPGPVGGQPAPGLGVPPGAPPGGDPGSMIAQKMAELNGLFDQVMQTGAPINSDAIAPELQSLVQNIMLVSSRDGGDPQQGAPQLPGQAPQLPGQAPQLPLQQGGR